MPAEKPIAIQGCLESFRSVEGYLDDPLDVAILRPERSIRNTEASCDR
ncbi:MAG TPA: hypothetical protein VMT64_16475 [Candidatus Binataceae bacterium]|nr:hypothetical protein [Candidatus Binataceae bacterium]